jgi:hypothetical protein
MPAYMTVELLPVRFGARRNTSTIFCGTPARMPHEWRYGPANATVWKPEGSKDMNPEPEA